jgi:hypothetical protein
MNDRAAKEKESLEFRALSSFSLGGPERRQRWLWLLPETCLALAGEKARLIDQMAANSEMRFFSQQFQQS